ncbi:hypothetical protein [Vulcanisaeta thermophila]|uniref:hypothetical protein n=1 Tax=Vulcanisaeta thermophila TaxID=867917 RepID=UPI000852AA43|nr:hypothetical protein [Vulcanisaeta thermophila]
MNIQVVALIGRLRIFLFLIIALLFIAAYFLGYAIKPSPGFAAQVNAELNNFTNQLSKLAPTAQAAYKITSFLASLGPSFIPIYGIWNTAFQWVITGIATNAVNSEVGMSLMAQTIILSIILSIPSTDGLIFTLMLINYARNREFRNLVVMAFRQYIMAVIMALILIIILLLIP